MYTPYTLGQQFLCNSAFQPYGLDSIRLFSQWYGWSFWTWIIWQGTPAPAASSQYQVISFSSLWVCLHGISHQWGGRRTDQFTNSSTMEAVFGSFDPRSADHLNTECQHGECPITHNLLTLTEDFYSRHSQTQEQSLPTWLHWCLSYRPWSEATSSCTYLLPMGNCSQNQRSIMGNHCDY